MSIESAKAFYQRMTDDASFRTPFEAELSKEERQQLIKDSGYDFTAEEWQQAMTEIQAARSNEELNEEELEAIAGGAVAAMYGVVFPWDNEFPWPRWGG
ncbi:Nif11-like leader peptide family natural product precursor [Pleurocapsa sp. PCC 7319]|uniref:Nif11-like leader peptide family natural product precursor n=1 Tax=Pleurocapsa sp. PCC 7319 TaxID=118161 RepID=UPI0003473169|nr:Nif11-like leader peptide family natural product precursor [Pleurocapsa sp. PCC 7319]